jgi:hypothetical protein
MTTRSATNAARGRFVIFAVGPGDDACDDVGRGVPEPDADIVVASVVVASISDGDTLIVVPAKLGAWLAVADIVIVAGERSIGRSVPNFVEEVGCRSVGIRGKLVVELSSKVETLRAGRAGWAKSTKLDTKFRPSILLDPFDS